MERIEILKGASKQVFERVHSMAGTAEAGGDYGVGAGGDISRNIDVTAERAVIEYCKEYNFGCVVLGEECGRIENSDNTEGFLVMDAIDGSANAVTGVPFFCCSLAIAENERLSSVSEAVVTDLRTGDIYWAVRGAGAFLGDAPIHTSTNPTYKIAALNTSGASPEIISKMQPLFGAYHTRHLGANALEMALLASGRLEVMADLRDKIRVHDMAAGYLLIREAGGIIVNGDMGKLESNLDYTSRLSFVAASNKEALDEVSALIGLRANG